ncbi:uncharacterized protein LOC115429965 isoform X2 [Sphaeramia orbicularis]|uniref:Uncharacterized LOC115429965 n=1 Tax=Sphaeramia orbicularis TaxID=375764 RepID=A0A672YCN6_9TELE|nr:uncharacterized protein LOC115429965 isoform X2 [Sphaeramia orbicularis]
MSRHQPLDAPCSVSAWTNLRHKLLIGNDFPVHYLRLLAPPLQIFSATMWQVVQQGLVDHYGMLEEFVTMVTELVPELMSYSQRAQLILGLRARLVLELCRGEPPVDMPTIQPHLDRIKAPVSTGKDPHVTINQVEESEVNFVELVHSLQADPSKRKYFFEEVFPVYFGSKYDAALEMLVWEFVSRLEELLPVPDFTQLASLLGDSPSFLEECLQSFFPSDDVKAILEHHRDLGHFEEKDPRLLPMDDCILSSLSLPSVTNPASNTASSPPTTPSEDKEHVEDPIISTTDAEKESRKSPENIRHRLRERKDKGSRQQDLATSAETEGARSAAKENGQTLRSGRALRKRKLSGGEDIPTEQPMEASGFMDSSVDGDNSGESPLISIWGDYTDSQEGVVPPVVDTKVPWSDEETLNLLDIWGKDSMQRALKGCLKNRHIFTQIAQKMAERGYMRTVEQCQSRIKRLKKCFRQKKRGNSRLEYKFSDQLKRVLDSSAPSSFPEAAYDDEEAGDEDESQEVDEDLQSAGRTSRPEIGTRSAVWTDVESLALIKTWDEDRRQRELRGMHRGGHIFSVISKKMTAQGFSRTPEQCQTRLKRLKSRFRQCYENNMRGREQVECKFYKELERILKKDLPVEEDIETTPEEPKEADVPDLAQQDGEAAVGPEDRKKVPWSDKETIILLEIWGDPKVQQSLKLKSHNGHIFTEISEKLGASGFSRSAEQCHTRIKRLKANYRHCQENMSSSGPADKVDFKFYELLEQIMDKQPSTSSAVVTDSIEMSEESNSESLTETDAEAMSAEKSVSSSWTDEETLALIEIWGEEEVEKALRDLVDNGHVYSEISEKLYEVGVSKTSEQCSWKINSLRNYFRHCYDRKKSGKRVDYKFYNKLEQILGQEAVSFDEFDEKDEQADQDSVADGVNTVWTDEETLTLIDIWAAEDVQHGLKTCVRNGHIYADIAEKMTTLGYPRSTEQCHSRIKRLKKTYRRYCNNCRSGGRPAMFRYYHVLAPVLGDIAGFAEMDNSVADAILQPLLDQDPDVYEQPSTSHLLAEQSKKMPWSDQETRVLLEIWGEDSIQLTLKGCLKNRHVFNYISEKMSEHGYIRTSEQCYTRVKRLKAGFLHEKEDFKYFGEMEEIFRKELKADGSVDDTSLAEESDDSTPVLNQNKGNQWMSDGSKLSWNNRETEVLLEIWGSEDIQKTLKGCTKNKHIFIQISKAMASQGFMRTPEQCQSRIKRLKANFRHFLKSKKKGQKQECKFFDHLVRIFGSNSVNSGPWAEDTADDLDL